MNKEFENLGVWMAWHEPYLTLEKNYIEAIWWTFKKAYEKKLLYLGKYPIHVCPRCETAVAYNEIVYTKIDDNSIYVKFPLKNEKNKFFIVWTTTPWTLPGNTGIMANPEFDYAEIELSNGEIWIIAEKLVPELMKIFEKSYNVKKVVKGKSLKGIEYVNPLSKHLNLKLQNAYKVVLSSRYVNLEEGTGLVHSAPGHGKEDYEVGKENNLDMPSPVGIDGILTEETGKYYGKKARIVDDEIIEDLEQMKMLVHKGKYSHDYPLCWRCKSPLLMISLPQWFFKIQSIHKRILDENERTKWHPKWMELRMKAWLEGISDWPISRNRYWGTPLPIWKCENCKKIIVIESIKELGKLSERKIKEIHKPEIDEVTIKCKKCDGRMKRVSEVLDVWFDAGVSSWAALEFPQKKELFKKFWPADLNIEGKDQVRGWWNSQLILSVIAFDKKPFENISVHGMVLDLGKKKMSKSLGNFVSPQDIIEKYSRDHLRYYFAKISRGEDFAFDEREFKNIENVFRVLENVNSFVKQIEGKSKIEIEDKWILSKLNKFIEKCIEAYNACNFPNVVELIENFLINDLSKQYIKMIRDRQDETGKTLNECLISVLKLMAPITPFICEKIFLENNKETIFLSEFPKSNKKKMNKKLENEFENVLKIIEAGLAERDKAGIGLKWPLQSANISAKFPLKNKLKEIIKSQLNVKEVFFNQVKQADILSVKLDTKLTCELEAEGYAREISRQIQAFRKKLGLEKKDKVETFIITNIEFAEILDDKRDFIKKRTNSRRLGIVTTEKERFKNKISFRIRDKRGWIAIIK